MKVINLGERSSVINSYMAQLRDVNIQDNRTLFRRNMQRIARAIAYEVSRTLEYSDKTITTPLGTKEVPTYDDRIVVGTVLRAGLAFHEGFLDTFDQADSAFVAAYREEGTRENIKIHVEYIAAPSLDGCTFLMVDPMLATGGSLELSYKAFLSHGTPKNCTYAALLLHKRALTTCVACSPTMTSRFGWQPSTPCSTTMHTSCPDWAMQATSLLVRNLLVSKGVTTND